MTDRCGLNKRQLDLDKHLRAMVNLYGYAPLGVCVRSFNRYNDDRTAKKEILINAEELNRYSKVYRIRPVAVINKTVSPSKIDEVLFYQQWKNFYVPTYDEIKNYASSIYYYERSTYTEKINRFIIETFGVKEVTSGLVIGLIARYAMRETSYDGGLKAIFTRYKLVFRRDRDCRKFISLYSDLSYNTRRWAECGFKPSEVESEKAEASEITDAFVMCSDKKYV